MTRQILPPVLLLLLGLICHADTTLLSAGATWTYLDNGIDQGTAWRNPGFNDSGWSSGAARFGYGDGNHQTLLDYGPNPFNKYPTYYFRRNFTVADISDCPYLKMRLTGDDGAVVYINGTEVWRPNMPGGTITYATLASTGIEGATETRFFEFTIPAIGLVSNGVNRIAVEIHQSSTLSTDMGFNFELQALVDPPLVPQDTSWSYLDTGANLGTGWTAPAYNDTSWKTGYPQFGYGENDELTIIDFGPNVFSKYITTYFRKTFTVPDASIYTGLKMRMVRDDGAVVYLNGHEVWRENMQTGPINYLTLAPLNIADGDETAWLTAFHPADGFLVDGANVLAIELHQSFGLSSDISLEFEFTPVTIQPEVNRGPYLQMGTHTSAVVRWRTDLATDSWVCWGDAPGNLTMTNQLMNITTEHSVTLTGLAPETTYYYAIGDTDDIFAGGDSDHFFTTSPVPGVPRLSTIWVLGDSGEANQNARDVRDAFYSWNGSVSPGETWVGGRVVVHGHEPVRSLVAVQHHAPIDAPAGRTARFKVFYNDVERRTAPRAAGKGWDLRTLERLVCPLDHIARVSGHRLAELNLALAGGVTADLCQIDADVDRVGAFLNCTVDGELHLRTEFAPHAGFRTGTIGIRAVIWNDLARITRIDFLLETESHGAASRSRSELVRGHDEG